MTDPAAFLAKIWGEQPDADYAFLAHKDWEDGTWQDLPVVWPGFEHDDGVPKLPDLYFAPCLFKDDRRLKANACGGIWLYADLDEVHPESLTDLPPHVAWSTSPGRYQAMWRLDEPLRTKAFERLNRAVTYATGADKGGWSATKVLRLPGTISTKHGSDFVVTLLWDREGTVTADHVREVCRAFLPPDDPGKGRIDLPHATGREIRRTHWKELSPRARKLIRTRTVYKGDDRSARLWELENLCLDAGLTPGETVRVVQDTVWNKYKGQRREERMLMAEVVKAENIQRAKGQVPERRQGPGVVPANVDTDVPWESTPKELVGEGRVLDFLPYTKFMGRTFPTGGWLVEHIWSRNAFGLWVGQDKAYKTTTVLDLAVSVASGEPFLGRFQVKNPGRVLYLHNEGKPAEVQGMLHRLAYQKGQFGPQGDEWGRPLPLDVQSMKGFSLTSEDDRERLLNYIRIHEPRAIILETWYLLAQEVDENQANEVTPIMNWLMRLAESERTSVIVSHHLRKGQRDGGRVSDMVSGSGVFGRAYESRFTIERVGEEEDHMALFQATHRYEKGLRHTIHVEYDKEQDEGFNVRFLSKEEEAMLRGGEVDFDKDGQGKVLPLKKPKRKSALDEPAMGISGRTRREVAEEIATRLAVEGQPFVLAKEYPSEAFAEASGFRNWLEALNCGWRFETRMVGDNKRRVMGYPPGVLKPGETKESEDEES